MRIVLDTNVLISALAFSGSKPDQILSRICRGEVELYTSSFILSELNRILREKFHFRRSEAEARVRFICTFAHGLVSKPLSLRAWSPT